MKKILIITLEFPPQIGGIATYVHNLASALDPNKTIVLAPPMKNSKEWDEAQKYKIVRKKLLFPKFIWPRWLRTCWHVRRIVKKEGIELIMVHHVLPVGYVGIINKKLRHIPFLLFTHGTDLIVGTRNWWKRKMVKAVSKGTEQIIFNSHSLQKRFLHILPDFQDKTTVVYPCPSQEYLAVPNAEIIGQLKSKYGLEGKKVLLSVSRLEEGKGFPHMVRILPEILKSVPNLVWVIVGSGVKEQEILERIQRENLQNIVRFVGDAPFGDLSKYYHLADAFLLLTHPDEGREEGLGLVFLEAAASGIPAIAGRSGGVEEAVLHGKTGLVVDVYRGDKELVKAIVELLNNKELALRLGKQAQERIKTEFQWEKQVEILSKWLG
jgi:phosphatidylinositol alpha-1,6-mannosyltransferase